MPPLVDSPEAWEGTRPQDDGACDDAADAPPRGQKRGTPEAVEGPPLSQIAGFPLEEVEAAARDIVGAADVATTSLAKASALIAEKLGVPRKALAPHWKCVEALIMDAVNCRVAEADSAAPPAQASAGASSGGCWAQFFRSALNIAALSARRYRLGSQTATSHCI